MDNYINTAATDIARARTVGLTQLTPEPFPILVVGTKPTQRFFFANRGTLESWSGNGDYTLRLTIGDALSRPVANTFAITVAGGATLTLPFDLDAAGLQNALNDDATIGTTDGGVIVLDRGFGRYLIAYKELGAVTSLSASASLLVPNCVAEIATLTAGSVSARQLLLLTLRQSLPQQLTNFSTITGGWSGVLDLTTAGAYQLMWQRGELRGAVMECTSLLTLEVIDDSGNPTAYYQTPVTLRALNYGDTENVTPGMLGVGPTRHAQASSAAGTVTVTPLSQLHTEVVTFTGSANTRNVVVGRVGLQNGAQIDLVCIFDGVADGVVINVYDTATTGTLLNTFTKAGGEANALFRLVATGSALENTETLIPAFYDPA